MKIVERSEDRLVLAGIPGDAVWMAVFVAFGGLGSVVAVWFAVLEVQRGNFWNLVPLGVGLLVTQAFFWLGAVTLAVGRERLELDRGAGRGRYEVRSPLVETGSKPFEFALSSVDSVSLEMTVESSSMPDASGQHRGSSNEVHRARLRVRRPRRAVVLLTRSDAGRGEVRELAEAVAGFLGVELADATSEDEPERRGSVAAMGGPLAAGRVEGDLELPDQPEPAEWRVVIDPDDQRITIVRRKRGGAPVLGCFLLIATFMAAIMIAMAVGVWLPGQTFNGRPIALHEQILITAPGVGAAVLVPWLWISLFTGRRRVTIDADRVSSVWLYPGRGFVRLLPGINRYLAGGESVPTGAVESVATIKGAQGRVVEVRAGRSRVRIGSAAQGEEAERDSLVWLAKAIRVSVRVLGG